MYSTSSYPPGTSLASRSSADPELYEAARPPSPRGPEGPAPTSENVTLSRRAAHYSVLVLASMIGTLIRLGLEALADCESRCRRFLMIDQGKVVFPLLWAQGVGCGIMGLGLANKNWVVLVYPPLYTGITTGAFHRRAELIVRCRWFSDYLFLVDAARLSSVCQLR